MVTQQEFNTYLDEVLIIVEGILNRGTSVGELNVNVLLMEDFPISEKAIYKKMQLRSMQSSRIWCNVFFKFPGWRKVSNHPLSTYAISESRKIIIKICNKYETFNNDQKKIARDKFTELRIEYPDYKIYVGFINDHKKRNGERVTLPESDVEVEYFSEDPLFKEFFGEEHYKIVQTRIEDFVFNFEFDDSE